MDKTSIVMDAINYIQELQQEEKRMTAAVAEQQSATEEKSSVSEITQDVHQVLGNKRRKKRSGSSILAPSSLAKSCVPVKEVKFLLVIEEVTISRHISSQRNKEFFSCENLDFEFGYQSDLNVTKQTIHPKFPPI